ncbi:MAG: NAD(P)-binding protein [Pseudonocardia sp.]|nr:NAD(P)-binding protein [Pseudonocardia sp.]
MAPITIIGGGLAGLTAAVACAETGAEVVVHEAHATLGGRARPAAAPWLAHVAGGTRSRDSAQPSGPAWGRDLPPPGPHALYTDGPHWSWLAERDLVGPVATIPLREVRGIRFHRGGRLRRTPPASVLPLLAHRSRRAPVDVDFHTWAAALHGEQAARAAAGLIGAVTYDSDPGRLSAAFVWGLLLRVTAPRAPAIRWVVGGWPVLVDRLAARARELGARIVTSSRVDALPEPPVIVATQLESARALLGDDALTWESGHCVLLDVGLVTTRRDAFVVADLDDAGFVQRVTGVDPTLAPAGHALVQADMPLKPGEPRAAALARLEHLLDLGFPRWRDRVVWRRSEFAAGRSGALDLPGSTWRDRPAVDRGDGVFLAGDLVAAPGMRGEVSLNSALHAARSATARAGAGVRIAG